MSLKKNHTSINQHLISLARKGFSILETTNQNEVIKFIQSRQHSGGGFMDRGSQPDLYYSLFGAWLAKALDLEEVILKHKQFVGELEKKQKSTVDKFTLILIKVSLLDSGYKKNTFWHLLKILFQRGENLNSAYAVFLFLLVFDALYPPNKMVYFFAKICLKIYTLPEDSPGSMLAALLSARCQLGLPVEKETKKLLSYFEEGKGFKVYTKTENADLLSTAVALFALRRAGKDLRIVAPDCLELIQQNFDSGAFLPGDGSPDKDLEYTFYGLLALGTLS